MQESVALPPHIQRKLANIYTAALSLGGSASLGFLSAAERCLEQLPLVVPRHVLLRVAQQQELVARDACLPEGGEADVRNIEFLRPLFLPDLVALAEGAATHVHRSGASRRDQLRNVFAALRDQQHRAEGEEGADGGSSCGSQGAKPMDAESMEDLEGTSYGNVITKEQIETALCTFGLPGASSAVLLDKESGGAGGGAEGAVASLLGCTGDNDAHSRSSLTPLASDLFAQTGRTAAVDDGCDDDDLLESHTGSFGKLVRRLSNEAMHLRVDAKQRSAVGDRAWSPLSGASGNDSFQHASDAVAFQADTRLHERFVSQMSHSPNRRRFRRPHIFEAEPPPTSEQMRQLVRNKFFYFRFTEEERLRSYCNGVSTEDAAHNPWSVDAHEPTMDRFYRRISPSPAEAHKAAMAPPLPPVKGVWTDHDEQRFDAEFNAAYERALELAHRHGPHQRPKSDLRDRVMQLSPGTRCGFTQHSPLPVPGNGGQPKRGHTCRTASRVEHVASVNPDIFVQQVFLRSVDRAVSIDKLPELLRHRRRHALRAAAAASQEARFKQREKGFVL